MKIQWSKLKGVMEAGIEHDKRLAIMERIECFDEILFESLVAAGDLKHFVTGIIELL